MSTLTVREALIALVSECELTLDYRPNFRAAMADAWRAIGSSESEDRELTFPDLFGEPLPDPVIHQCACTDGVCSGLTDEGRDATGAHCKAHMQDQLEQRHA